MSRSKDAKASTYRSSGFTLVEVMVASAILLIVILGITSAFSYVRKTVYSMEKRGECVHAARGIMEQFRALPYSDSRLQVGKNQPIPSNFQIDNKLKKDASCSVSYCTFDGETLPDTATDPGSKDITVVIKWNNMDGGQESVSMTTTHSRILH